MTVGALVAMAAHLEGKGTSVLDFTGLAHKFGPVLSYLRLATRPEELFQVRIDDGSADALIGCDVVVSTSPKASATYRAGMGAVVNTAEMPTGDIVQLRDADLNVAGRLKQLVRVIGAADMLAVDANALAEQWCGDAVFANVIMLGAAWQRGLVPVSLAALMRAIALNKVAVETNKAAFAIGRIACAHPAALNQDHGSASAPESLDRVIARREEFLRQYQNVNWAKRYRDVPANSSIARADQIDARGIRIGVTKGGTSERVLSAKFKNAKILPAESVAGAVKALRAMARSTSTPPTRPPFLKCRSHNLQPRGEFAAEIVSHAMTLLGVGLGHL